MEELKKVSSIKPLIIITILSIILMITSLTMAMGFLEMEMFLSYFKSFKLLILNFLPIFIFMLLLFIIFNRLWLSFFLTSSLVMLGGVANRAKIIYRDDPLVMMDIRLIKEAGMMSKRYEIPVSLRIILTIIIFLVVVIFLKKFFDYKIESKKYRILSLVAVLLVSTGVFKNIYLNQKIYDSVGDVSIINRWIESQRYQSKGFIYPFVYSAKDVLEIKPQNYNPKNAQETLARYEYDDIPQEKKVNLIGIMLEAYNDFSKFPSIQTQNGVYDYFHELQENAVHGTLVTNIFAGGTVDTERAFLTGYQHQPKYNKETNSFVRYFNEQGYKTEAMHPVTGSFYNRRNINEYLGFQNFDHGDNKYKGTGLTDIEFLPTIIEGFEKSKKENKPYFNFSVTYQNHGPYAKEKYHELDYLQRKPEYDEGLYNIANNYFYGIKDTGENLKNMIDYFEKQKEPVVVVLFGDHNPWLGEQNSVYKMLGIDLNLETPEGFRNYYETPYIIWANTSAKDVLQKDFIGNKGEISSMYLMAQTFEEMGYKGNSYMKYIMEMKSILPVQHNIFFKENQEYKKKLSIYDEKYKEFLNAEYYYSRNKID